MSIKPRVLNHTIKQLEAFEKHWELRKRLRFIITLASPLGNVCYQNELYNPSLDFANVMTTIHDMLDNTDSPNMQAYLRRDKNCLTVHVTFKHKSFEELVLSTNDIACRLFTVVMNDIRNRIEYIGTQLQQHSTESEE